MMNSDDKKIKFHNILELSDLNETKLRKIIADGKPVLLKGCRFGDCLHKWTLDYLTRVLGDDEVVIHESQESDLDFVNKNFKYRSCKFSEFAKCIMHAESDGTSVYLRSTNRNPRAKKAASIDEDFPALSGDFEPPSYIPYGRDNRLYHSSVLRIASSNVQIWTHFDLYNNVLSQVVGAKRIILIPPEDTRYLYIEGDKSRVNCFENPSSCLERFPLISKARLHICHLVPGDCLFIPSLWWHNVKTVQVAGDQPSTYSIGFNIFWRDEDINNKPLYADNDVYGNKNLQPYDSALVNLDKALHHLNKLPSKYNCLYKVLLYQQFKNKFEIGDD